MDVMLNDLAPILRESGLEVYNCNRRSCCTAFDYVPFDEAYWDCKGGVPEEPWDLDHWYDKKPKDGKRRRTAG